LTRSKTAQKARPKGPKKRHGIVIDADPEALDQAVVVLEAVGYVVHPYDDARRVMSMLESKYGKVLVDWRPSIIIADVSLPNLGGYEFIRRVISSSLAEGIPLLLMSRYRCVEDATDAYNTGAHGLLTKPISEERLKSAIKEYESRKDKPKTLEIVWGGGKSEY
jgi:CheY-like chemotaxis protein